MADTREQFSQRLEDFFTNRGLTNREVAESVQCTGATIGRWRRGEVPYCILILAGLRKHHGVDLNKLICGEDK